MTYEYPLSWPPGFRALSVGCDPDSIHPRSELSAI